VAFGFLGVVSPLVSLALAAGGLGILFLALANFRIAACLERAAVTRSNSSPRRADRDLPVYTIVVPLYREAGVVADLCNSLRDIDYPPSQLDIKLMTEADDEATCAALEALDLPGAFEIIVAPDGKPRTKPRALNVALPLARGEYLVVFDAEDRPDHNQLRLAVEAFAREADDVCCLQARLAIDNAGDGFLARCFAIEYAALFDVINPGLARLGLPVPLGGTSNHFRVEALRRLGGWDAWNVTEDADLGIRLARAGYRVADLPSTTFEEAPCRYGVGSAQRARWMKGFLQTAITHSREPRRTIRQLGATAFIGAAALTLGSVLAAMLYPVFVTLFLLVALSIGMAGLGFDPQAFLPVRTDPQELSLFMIVMAAIGFVTFCAGLVSMLAPPILGLWRRRWFTLLPWVPLMPVYYLFVSLAAWRGLAELVIAPSRWNKTQHGLSLSRRQT
jgi:glycosyltransferase XagB